MPLTKQSIYDEMCAMLTDYENGDTDSCPTDEDLYTMLVKIQTNWETVITAEE